MNPQVAAMQPLGETLTDRQRWMLLLTLMLAMFAGALGQMVVGTAIPSIVSDLGGFNLITWLFNGFMLSSTVVVPLVGKLSDVFGRKIFLIGGMLVFTAGSMASGLATTMLSLIVFRTIQGVGSGMLMAAAFATIGDIFPPAQRGKYMGLFTGAFSLASVLGPNVGGVLTDHLSWRWIFFLNAPVAIISIPAMWAAVPTRRMAVRPKIDYLGAGLMSASSVFLLLALVWGGNRYDWASAEIAGLIGASLVTLAAFIWQESRHPEPMLPLHLFKNRVFLLSNLVVFTVGMAMFGTTAYLPTFVQTALGASATASAVITTPQSIAMFLCSLFAGMAVSRLGRYRYMVITGAGLTVLAMALLTTMSVGMPRWHLSAYMVVIGAGMGLSMPIMSLVIQNAVPYQYLGVASSSSQFFRQIGGVLGTAIFGAVLANSYASAFEANLPETARAAIPAETLALFDDPTLQMNLREFAAVKKEILPLPGGAAILDAATGAQNQSVADAMHDIFLGGTAIAVLSLLFTLVLPELPLRRDFKGMAAAAAAPPGDRPGEAAARIAEG